MQTNWPKKVDCGTRAARKPHGTKATRAQARRARLVKLVNSGELMQYVPHALRGIHPAPDPADAPRCDGCGKVRVATHVCLGRPTDPHPAVPTRYACDGHEPSLPAEKKPVAAQPTRSTVYPAPDGKALATPHK